MKMVRATTGIVQMQPGASCCKVWVCSKNQIVTPVCRFDGTNLIHFMHEHPMPCPATTHALPATHCMPRTLLKWLRPALATLGMVLVSHSSSAQTRPSLDVPYIKTPPAVIERMLELGRVGPDDYLIDLGSGDGRIPIAAARKHGTRGYGVDLDPERTIEARAAAKEQGVSDRVTFKTENLFDTDLSQATVISMYLFPEINLRLRPYLFKLKPGTRIVSHAFHMEDWTPEHHDVVDGNDVFMWTIPADIEGLWQVTATERPGFVLRVWQELNRVQAVAITLDERSVPVMNMRISGTDIQFSVNTPNGPFRFQGTTDGKKMQGTIEGAGSWSATRM